MMFRIAFVFFVCGVAVKMKTKVSSAAASMGALDVELDEAVLQYNGEEKTGPSTEVAMSPLMMVGLLGGLVVAIVAICVLMRYRAAGSYEKFGAKSGLSTSSSDITSSETGSTDRELKSRMERFEKRLDEHKKMLELKGDGESSSVTDSESKLTGDVTDSSSPWARK